MMEKTRGYAGGMAGVHGLQRTPENLELRVQKISSASVLQLRRNYTSRKPARPCRHVAVPMRC